MKIVGIIPARYASTRFPGKPLAPIAGKPLIQRVVEQCRKAKSLNEVTRTKLSALLLQFWQHAHKMRPRAPFSPSRLASARQVVA